MPLDIQRPDLALGIVGTGIMGRGIAQIAAQAGIRVVLYDTRADAAPAAQDYVAGALAKLAEKGRMPAGRGGPRHRTASRSRHVLGAARRVPRRRSRRSSRTSTRSASSSAQLEAIVAADCAARDQHLVAAGHRDRRGVQASRARRRLPFLQPGAAHEGRRGDRRRADRAVGRRRAHRARAAHGPHAGARAGHAGLHRQSRRPRLRHRGARMRCAKASPSSARSTAACAIAPASAWGRSSSST